MTDEAAFQVRKNERVRMLRSDCLLFRYPFLCSASSSTGTLFLQILGRFILGGREMEALGKKKSAEQMKGLTVPPEVCSPKL